MGKQGYNAGDLSWSQLDTTDAAAAASFYAELTGVEISDGPTPDYKVMKSAGENQGGITGLTLKAGPQGPHWFPYFTVADIEVAAAKVEALGGKVLERFEMPNMMKYAIFLDPQGAKAAVIQYLHGPY